MASARRFDPEPCVGELTSSRLRDLVRQQTVSTSEYRASPLAQSNALLFASACFAARRTTRPCQAPVSPKMAAIPNAESC